MLPKKNRLKSKKDFDRVHNRGRFYADAFLAIKTAKNNLDNSRFGFLVGLKVSKKAVERNKIKRRLRASVRQIINDVKPGFDVVVMVKPEIIDKDYNEIDGAMKAVLNKSGIFKI